MRDKRFARWTAVAPGGQSDEIRPALRIRGLAWRNSLAGDFMFSALHGILHRTVPDARVQGRGVLLIPGFLSGDYSLSPLAARLEALGYRIFFSGIWYNVHCPFHTLPRLENVLRKANDKTQAKVVLIGHSLGGIYARELACRFPNLVEPQSYWARA